MAKFMMDIFKNRRVTAVLMGALVLLIACVAWNWRAFPSPVKVLACSSGLILVVAVVYWQLRPRKKLDEALKESHYEKFRRLEGLYLTIPKAVRNQPENKDAVEEFENQRKTLEGWVNNDNKTKTFNFTRDDAPDLVHNLHLAFLQIAPIDFLHFYIQSIESEYRQAVGATAYDAYLAALMEKQKPADPSLTQDDRNRLLRSQAIYLVNETRRQQLLRAHAQSTRQNLLNAAFRSWWVNVVPLLAVLLVFFVGLPWVRTSVESASPPMQTSSWTAGIAQRYLIASTTTDTPDYTPLFKILMTVALLALAGIAGATGGMMSVIQRVQASTPESDALTDLLALSQAETAVFFAPVTGVIFAFVLSFFFAGGILSGSVFPLAQGDANWFLTLFNGKALAIWLLWAFLAGFSERLVPDALDSLAKQQQSNINSKSTPSAGARNVAPQSPGPGEVSGPQIEQLDPKTIRPPSSQSDQTIEVTGKRLANISVATLVGPDNAGKNDVAR